MKNVLVLIFILALLLFAASQLGKGTAKSSKFLSFLQPGYLTTTPQENSSTSQNTGSTNQTTSSEPEKPKVEAPLGYDESDLSPFYKKVEIRSVDAPDYFGDRNTKLTIYANNDLKAEVNITGWTVRANLGGSFSVPRAVSDYSPQGLNPEGDIILAPGNSVDIFSWRSVITKNLRLNKCTGYLNQMYSFNPSLPENCPRIEEKRAILFTGRCQNFLRDLKTCRTPSANDINVFATTNDVECRKVADRFNFGDCYSDYRNTSDFFSDTWYVWLNEPMRFDPLHDRLVLLDRKGLVVNEYVY